MSQVTQVIKPSRARKLALEGFIPMPRGSTTFTPPTLSWPPKDPADVLDYQLDISAALVGNSGDAIASVTATISPDNPGDLVCNSVTVDGPNIVLWLSGGQAATVYGVTIAATLGSGRALQRTILLPVIALSSLSPPPTAIETDTGYAITDQFGNPVITSDPS